MAKFIEFRRALVLVALLSSVGGTAFAQSVSSGVIEGTVKDASGGVLPGATITASSPQLQVGQVNKVSGADGNYRFIDLPAGVYKITAELPGFATSVRAELRLTVGFSARVDMSLKVGGTEETITVTGQSPWWT